MRLIFTEYFPRRSEGREAGFVPSHPSLPRGSLSSRRTPLLISCACALFWYVTFSPLTRAGEVVAWGYNNVGQTNVPAGLSNVVFIAAGGSNSLAVTSDGRVVVWGFGQWYGLTNVPAEASNIVAAAVGSYHILALSAEGRVTAWGNNNDGQTNVPLGLSNVVAVAAWSSTSLALTADGRVVGWGLGSEPGFCAPASLRRVVAIQTKDNLTAALVDDGHVVVWGCNPEDAENILSGVSNIVGLSQDWALSNDGHVVSWSYWPEERAFAAALTNIAGGAWGGFHSLALGMDGRVIGWAASDFAGQSVPPEGLSNVIQVAAGEFHSLALVDRHSSTAYRVSSQTVTNGVAILVPTQRGRAYVLERKLSLNGLQWSVLQRFAGDGAVRKIVVQSADQAFFRARRIP